MNVCRPTLRLPRLLITLITLVTLVNRLICKTAIDTYSMARFALDYDTGLGPVGST